MGEALAKAGPENTEEALTVAFTAAKESGLRYVVVASTHGDTAKRAWELARKGQVQLVVVTHNTGFEEPGEQQFDDVLRRELNAEGVPVVTATMPFRNISRALRDRFGYSELDVVASTLRIFGEGMKVCAEIACMACDAGAIPATDVICVAGTARGADTVAVVKAQPSNRFFDLKVREILRKPADF